MVSTNSGVTSGTTSQSSEVAKPPEIEAATKAAKQQVLRINWPSDLKENDIVKE